MGKDTDRYSDPVKRLAKRREYDRMRYKKDPERRRKARRDSYHRNNSRKV